MGTTAGRASAPPPPPCTEAATARDQAPAASTTTGARISASPVQRPPAQRHPVDPPVRHQQAPDGRVLQQARPAGDGRPGVPPRDLHRVEVQVVRVVRRAQHPPRGDPRAQPRDGARIERGEAHAVAPGALHLLLQLRHVLREAGQLEAPRDEAGHRLARLLGEAHDLRAGAHRDPRQQLAGPDLLRQSRRPGRRLRRRAEAVDQDHLAVAPRRQVEGDAGAEGAGPDHHHVRFAPAHHRRAPRLPCPVSPYPAHCAPPAPRAAPGDAPRSGYPVPPVRPVPSARRPGCRPRQGLQQGFERGRGPHPLPEGRD